MNTIIKIENLLIYPLVKDVEINIIGVRQSDVDALIRESGNVTFLLYDKDSRRIAGFLDTEVFDSVAKIKLDAFEPITEKEAAEALHRVGIWLKRFWNIKIVKMDCQDSGKQLIQKMERLGFTTANNRMEVVL